MKERISHIDGLRALACMVVVLHHSVSSFYLWGQPLASSFYGAYAVAFFFVLAGYCLELGYADRTWSWGEYGHFCLRRVARLWPLHALLLFVVIVTGLGATCSSVWRNLFLLQSWSEMQMDYFGYNAVSWFASAILACYALYPLLSRKFGLCLVFAVVASLYGGRSVSPPEWVWINPCFHVIEVMIGIAAYRLSKRRMLQLRSVADTSAELMALMILLLIPTTCFAAYGLDFKRLIWAACCGGFLLVLTCGRGWIAKILVLPPFPFVGKISFEIFMVHKILLRALEKYPLFMSLPGCVRFPIYLLTVVCSSWLLHKTFVMPISRAAEAGYVGLVLRCRPWRLGIRNAIVPGIVFVALMALLGYRNGLVEIQWEKSSLAVQLDGTQWAKGEVHTWGLLLHPGDSPTAVAGQIPERAEVMKFGFYGYADGDLLLRICIDGKERLVRRVQGADPHDAALDVRGGCRFRIEVDKNGQLSCDGLVIDGPRFYRKANVQ